MTSVCRTQSVLTAEETKQLMSTLNLPWTLVEGGALKRTFVCRNWKAAIEFINAASAVAEGLGHHPDLSLAKYRVIEITIFTHSLTALTQLDFKLATEIEKIPVDYSPKWLVDNPQ